MTDVIVSLPISVVSGDSVYARLKHKVITETFSTIYKEALSNNTLLELGVIFQNVHGKSTTTIKNINRTINLLCKYMVQNNILDLSKIDSDDLSRFIEFIKRETALQSYWNELYKCLKTNASNTPLSNLMWPRSMVSGSGEGKTEGHTMYAYNAMGVALREEINRIRGKKGRLVEDMKIGRVLQLTDLLVPGQTHCGKHFIRKIRPEYDFTKADIVRTAAHYLPGWPITNSLICSSRWGVYKKLNGVRLGIFSTKEAADRYVATCNTTAFTIYIQKDTMNPAELLLYSLVCKTVDLELNKYTKTLFSSILNVIDFYFTTAYDWQCVYLYWTWLTGWNNEAIASVSAHDLNLGIDLRNKCSTIEVLAPHHIEIKSKKSTTQTNEMQRSRSTDDIPTQVNTITGYKTRAQPDHQPKEYIYICDKNNDYDLYRVLADFYELTKPLRGFLKKEDKNCILVGVSSSRTDDRGRRLSIFGPPLHCTPPEYRATGLGRFFQRNPIYDDEHERIDGIEEKADSAADALAACPNRYTRLLQTTSMKMRNSFATARKIAGDPLFVRQSKLNHERESTTNTCYGADRVEKGIRRRQLRGLLNDIERLAFQGQLQQYDRNTSTLRKGSKNKIIQIFSHLQTDVFLCLNPEEPTWLGHEEYTHGHCTEFDECLFCKNCIVTFESLPVLVRWRRDIKTMPTLVGPVGISDKIYLRLQAIDEVFDLCRHGGQEWREALEKAYEIEMDPAFTAPDLMYRY